MLNDLLLDSLHVPPNQIAEPTVQWIHVDRWPSADTWRESPDVWPCGPQAGLEQLTRAPFSRSPEAGAVKRGQAPMAQP